MSVVNPSEWGSLLIVLFGIACSNGMADAGALPDINNYRDARVADRGQIDASRDAGLDAGNSDVISYGRMMVVPVGPAAAGCDSFEHADWCELPDYNCCNEIEQPASIVVVPEFRIDATEVTVDAYQECVDNGPCIHRVGPPEQCNRYHRDRGNYPVNCVTLTEARSFCSWAGKRLCSESEWEKAARGGCEYWPGDCALSTPPSWFGSRPPTCDEAVVTSFVEEDFACGHPNGSAPVGSRARGSSVYGVHDLIGNVYEFVEDCYHLSNEGRPRDGSAWTSSCAAGGPQGVTKGGSAFSPAATLTSALRRNFEWAGYESCCGFRCCQD